MCARALQWTTLAAVAVLSATCTVADKTKSKHIREAAADSKPGGFQLTLRKRVLVDKQTGRYEPAVLSQKWDPRRTAVIVCDMWDLHHCLNATRRGAEMAPRMNAVLKHARKSGATIIHAPSSCMASYKDHPARKRAQATPRSQKLPTDIGKWCHWIPAEERDKYPIDQSDGGEDDEPAEHASWAAKLKQMGRNPRAPWKSQTDLLDIADGDYISDNGAEVWSILEQNRCDNVILVGVHTNMCVLGRPFGLRQMSKNGRNVVLMRDMTDTMYNPKRKPFVSHFTGTDLIVEHIEKYVCPTITSDQLLGGEPFAFKHDVRKRLVMLIAEREYKTEQSLPKFAVEHLGKHFRVSYVYADAKDRHSLPEVETTLKDADVLFVSVRRRTLKTGQLAAIRKFVAAGKPVIGIRTASHAFAIRGGQQPPKGRAVWNEFDADVFGGNYHGHHGNGPVVQLTAAPIEDRHRLFKGVDMQKFASWGSLYQVSPLKETAVPILIGTIPGKPAEPVAWINRPKAGNRVFYTSLGHIKDFEQPSFNRFLRNAVYWAAGVEVGDSSPRGNENAGRSE